jgi:serine/threonine-protein kinase HipA
MPVCRSTLKPIARDGFSPSALRRLTGGAGRLPHRIPFTRADVIHYRATESARLSISGVQDKVSLRLEDGELRPVIRDGMYILKPVPGLPSLRQVEAVPANEHLTQQIAGQVFGIPIPPCALVELADGEPAYIVRRFDRLPDGTRIPQEDFCQLSLRSEAAGGRNYKYDGTQEETGRILRRHCPAAPVQLVDLFRRHLFNYLVSNGDAHLKNFSLLQSPFGDHLLSPAYDLLCTALHLPDESRCALDMFDQDETDFHRQNGFYGRPDFLLLAEKFRIPAAIAEGILTRITHSRPEILSLVQRSFLPAALQQEYLSHLDDRLLALR